MMGYDEFDFWREMMGCMAAVMGCSPRVSGSANSVREDRVSFDSDGVEIEVERFAPGDVATHPGVILVHGADGLTLGPIYRALAREIAGNGYHVFLPHYFDRTQTRISDTATNARNFSAWLQTLSDAIAFAAGQERVDHQHLALVGISLGAYLSTSQASIDPRIKAVVDYYGGIPDSYAGQLRTMPPTLILHGEEDRVVPVSEARHLEELLKDKGVLCDAVIYPNQGHVLSGQDAQDAMVRTVAFLDKHLRTKSNAKAQR